MFKIKFRLLAQNAFGELLHRRSVVGMNPLANQLQLGLNRRVIIKDFVSFLGPVDFSAANVPRETAGVTYALPLSQEILAALQFRIEVGVLQRNRSLRSQQFQHCGPSPRRRMSRPRSAPACSTAIRKSCSISLGRSISLERACEAFMTVSTSNCPADVPIVAVVDIGSRSSCRRG